MSQRERIVCANCVMDTTDPEIKFDEHGRCDFCENYYKSILPHWHPEDSAALSRLVADIKKAGQGKKYDCIIGLSGGVDSSYLAYVATEKLGLRPLLYSVDTGWNLDVANENTIKVVRELNLDVVTEVVDWEEMKDLQVAFLKSGVPYQDLPQDHAIFAALYNYASSHGIKYVLTGGNYSTECIQPPYEWVYFNDLRLIMDIHRKFGTRPLRNFPVCSMFRYRILYRYFKGMRHVRLLNMLPYHKDAAVAELQQRFGWQPYANKHYEDIFTRFYEGYWLPKAFGYDKRKCYFSSLILTGQMTREEALLRLAEEPYEEAVAMDDAAHISSKLGITVPVLLATIEGKKQTYRDYANSAGAIKLAIKAAKILGAEKRNFR